MDLAAYLARIGHAGAREPTRAVLARVVAAHVRAIAFENIDAFLGRPVSLDPGDVARKLVHGGRGGWCFEQNLLLGEALRAMGFAVTDLAARVVWGRAPDAIVPRTHRALRVDLEGRAWFVDVGFGGQTLTGVLDLDSEAPQATPHEPYRLQRVGPEWLLWSLVRGEWLPLMRFDLQPQQPVDFEAANFQLVHDPASHFTQGLRVSRVVDAGRHVLRDLALAWHPLQGESRRETLDSPEAVLQALRAVFGIDTAGVPGLRERLARQFALQEAQAAAGAAAVQPGSPERS